MDKIEETIKAIAVRHGIAVGRDDPILILQTLNERLMQDNHEAQKAILEEFKSELEAIAHRWSEDSKEKAERTLNAALSASKEAMTQRMVEGSKVATETIQRELSASVAKLSTPIRVARQVAIMNMISAVLAVLAASIVLWALR